MPNLKELKQLINNYEQTFDDANFSRNEKNAIKQIIKEMELETNDINFIRNKIFDIARSAIHTENSPLVLDWVETANKTLNIDSASFEEEAFFSPGDDCVDAIVSSIRSATRSIDICVFTITDNRISNEIKAAHDKGVKVRIISDNDKSLDRGSDIDELFKHGISTKVDYTDVHMHHKFAIFDNVSLITGSYNWTRSAGKYNYENILRTNNAATIKKYQVVFEDLWLNMRALEY